MIDQWRFSSSISSDVSHHTNSVITVVGGEHLTVSQLSRLQVAPPVPISLSAYNVSDVVVSSYMALLQQRSDDIRQTAVKRGFQPPPHSAYMDGWVFRSTLIGSAVKRRRLDLDRFEQILIPVILEGHWVLGVCYQRRKIIGVYDPFGTRREDVFNRLKAWAEVKLSSSEGPGDWRFEHLRESRGCVQKGVIDCGIYVCKAAEPLGLGVPIRISQWDIPYVRKRMTVEFILKRATPIPWPR